MGVLTVTVDERDPTRLLLRGDVGADVQSVLDQTDLVLASAPSRLVVDVRGVTPTGEALAALLNALAARATAAGTIVLLEVPEDGAEWLASTTIDSSIHIERTSPLPTAPARRKATATAGATAAGPADGVGRREGVGFITSYGTRRACAASGCTTALSRYNGDTRCELHKSQTRGGGQRTLADDL